MRVSCRHACSAVGKRPFSVIRAMALVRLMDILVLQCILVILAYPIAGAGKEGSGSLKKFPLKMLDVRPTVIDSYLCTSITIDPNEEYYITAFDPSSYMEIAHHMMVFACENPGANEEVYNCGAMERRQKSLAYAPVCTGYAQIIYAWARNASKLVLPPGIGFKIGGSTNIKTLVLQVHYASVEEFKDGSTDDSGVNIYYTKERQPKSAGVLMLGSGGRILPKSIEYFEIAAHLIEDIVLHPFAFRTHTHDLGRVVSGYKVVQPPNSIAMNWTLIGKKDPQLPQMFYPVIDKKLTLTKGDTVAARCTMESDRDIVTRVGDRKEDEMCNFYIMYWTDGPTLSQNQFFSIGPPFYYWGHSNLRDIPNEEASSLPVGQSAKEMGYTGAAF